MLLVSGIPYEKDLPLPVTAENAGTPTHTGDAQNAGSSRNAQTSCRAQAA